MPVRSGLKSIATGLLASIVVFVSLEAVARIGKTVEQDLAQRRGPPPEQGFIYSPTLGWDRKPGYRGVIGHYQREFDSAGYFTVDSEQIADTTKKKVIFIGDSNTFGHGAPTQSSFVEVVEGLVPGINAINLGVSGYTSFQGRVAFDKQLPLLKPDLVVVSFNYNDRRYVFPSDGVDSAEEFRRVYQASVRGGARIGEVLDASYFVRAVRRVMTKVGMLPSPVTDLRVDAVVPRVGEDGYRNNLSHIAKEAQRLGIPLIFLALKDNPIESHYLNEGVASLSISAEQAAAYLNVAVESRNTFSDLARIYLAKAYQAQGNPERAAQAVISSRPIRSVHGGLPVRLDAAYNDIMRQVARDHAVALVDATEVLDQNPSDFIDFCHFNADGHRRVGQLLAGRISEILFGGAAAAGTGPGGR